MNISFDRRILSPTTAMTNASNVSPSAWADEPPAGPGRTYGGGRVIHREDRDCGPTTPMKADSFRGFFPRTFSEAGGGFSDSPTASATGSSGGEHSPVPPPTPAAGATMVARTSAVGFFGGSISPAVVESPASYDYADHRGGRRVVADDSPASAATSGHSSGARIDHTALLLGFLDESRHDGDDDDDEREWNASFSLDELEGGRSRSGGGADDDVGADDNAREEGRARAGEDDDGRREYGFGDDENRGDDVGFRGASSEDAAASYPHDERGGYGRPLSASTTQLPQQKPQQKPPLPIAQPRPTAYLRTSSNGTKHSLPPTTPRSPPIGQLHPTAYIRTSSMPATPRSPLPSGIKQLSKSFPPIGSDAWRKEEEDNKTYFNNTPRLKKYESFEHKKKMATMKALAMKERASSALASKAARAKERVKEKIVKKISSLGDGQQDQQHQGQGLRERLEQPKGMEITTTDHDDVDVLSQVSEVSNGFGVDKNPYTSATKSIKSKLSSSHAKLSRETNAMKSSLLSSSKVSQIASTKLKSGKSAVLDMIKDPLLRNVNANIAHEQNIDTTTIIASTSTTGSTSSLLNRPPGKSTAIVTRRRAEVPPNVREEDDSVLSIDGDVMSNVPNSEGTSSFRHDANCLNMAGMSSRLAHTIVTPGHTFSTPRAATSKNNGNTGTQQVRGNTDTDTTPPKNNLTRSVAHHGPALPMSPPQIATCLSDTSSRTGGICIDSNGFLISPNASVDRGWDEAASATLGSEGTFDPNSFLFLSPLSNHDFDDPDYGMPELLSRSNSRNAVVLDKADPAPGPPEDAKSTASTMTLVSPTKALSKRLSRLPPSPRLLPLSPQKLSPSGKAMMKKMKIAAGRNSVGPNKASPILHRSFTSTF